MSFASSRGWRSIVIEQLRPNVDGPAKPAGEAWVFQVLAPEQPDPTQQELDAIAATYSKYGGAASCRVLQRLWWPVPPLTEEQQRAVAGIE